MFASLDEVYVRRVARGVMELVFSSRARRVEWGRLRRSAGEGRRPGPLSRRVRRAVVVEVKRGQRDQLSGLEGCSVVALTSSARAAAGSPSAR